MDDDFIDEALSSSVITVENTRPPFRNFEIYPIAVWKVVVKDGAILFIVNVFCNE